MAPKWVGHKLPDSSWVGTTNARSRHVFSQVLNPRSPDFPNFRRVFAGNDGHDLPISTAALATAGGRNPPLLRDTTSFDSKTIHHFFCGLGLLVGLLPSKQMRRVRFSQVAPYFIASNAALAQWTELPVPSGWAGGSTPSRGSTIHHAVAKRLKAAVRKTVERKLRARSNLACVSSFASLVQWTERRSSISRGGGSNPSRGSTQ